MKFSPSPLARTIIALSFIFGVASALSIAAYLHTGSSALLSLAITFRTFFYHFAMRLLVGAALPNITATDCRWFQPRSFEPKLYARLAVRRWKKHIPTYNPNLFSPTDISIEHLLQNSCRAELIHEIIMVLSFLPVLAINCCGAPLVFWGTSLLAALFDSLFVIVQRFNRPRLIRILKKERSRHA